MYTDEPPNLSYVLAEYQSRRDGVSEPRPEPWQTVWFRDDREPGQERGDWYEVRGPVWAQTPAGSVRVEPPSEPDSWGVVCGLDDPEPYGVSQIVLWRDDECEPWAQLERFARRLIALDDPDPASAGNQERRTVTLNQIIGWAREALGEKE